VEIRQWLVLLGIVGLDLLIQHAYENILRRMAWVGSEMLTFVDIYIGYGMKLTSFYSSQLLYCTFLFPAHLSNDVQVIMVPCK